ncbi:hypothetical protein [Spirosoma gilvum]
MRRLFFFSMLLSLPCLFSSMDLISAELRSAPVRKQQPSPNRPAIQRNRRDTTKPAIDSTSPRNRKQPRLRPDSLRRGGATKVDTVRR